MKGVTLQAGQVVDLSLDGTRVYIEEVAPTHLTVVPLPEQPPDRANERVFMPGRVGGRKISPMAEGTVIAGPHSARNQNFIDTYKALRDQFGQNYIGDDELRKDAEVAANLPDKATIKANAKAARQEAKEARKASKGGPRFLQRCVTCNEQPGHPSHGTNDGQHEFVAPPEPVVEIKCLACDELEAHNVHAKDKADGGHKFIAPGKTKVARTPKPEREPTAPKAPRAPSTRSSKPTLVGKYKWVENPGTFAALRAGNAKYNDGNSGAAIVQVIKDAGEVGTDPTGIVVALATHTKWGGVSMERIEFAFQQMVLAGLLVSA